MKFANATKFYRKSGGVEGSAVQRTSPGNVFDRWRSGEPALSEVEGDLLFLSDIKDAAPAVEPQPGAAPSARWLERSARGS